MDEKNGTKNVLKLVIAVIVIAIIIITGVTIRKFSIINKYIKKDESNVKESNIYMKWTSNSVETEIWIKGEKYKEQTSKRTIYQEDKNSSTAWLIFEDNDKKAYEIDNYGYIGVGTNTTFMAENFIGKLQQAFRAKIKVVECNGVKCYEITKKEKDNTESKMYVNKENYMPVRKVGKNEDYSYEIKINSVTEEDVLMPDLTGYEIERLSM